MFSSILCESHRSQQSLNDVVPLNAESSFRAEHDMETSQVNMFSEVQLGDSFWQHPAGAGISLTLHPSSAYLTASLCN
jgi:hypothetical protein